MTRSWYDSIEVKKQGPPTVSVHSASNNALGPLLPIALKEGEQLCEGT